MASLPIGTVETVINRAAVKGEAIKNGRLRTFIPWQGVDVGDLREQYAATNDGHTFTLRHWGTEILKLDLDNHSIIDYYGESNSDRDAINTAFMHFGFKQYAYYRPANGGFGIED